MIQKQVYVINKNGKSLMPCSPAKARILLKEGKAKCKRREPFTIKLLFDCEENTQKLILGIDTGSKEIGFGVTNEKNEVIYVSEVICRNDVKEKMDQRRMYRRNRRNRKTRYRKARWLNRKNSIKNGRFSPTMVSKFHSHIKEIEYIRKILPITDIIVEVGNFDPHALKNPEVLKNKILYQQGTNYGFANTKAYVLARDNYTCLYCKGKSKSTRLHVHHIVFRSNGGSDDEKNLATTCDICHDKIHKGKIESNIKGIKKGTLKFATQMNSIRIQIWKYLKTLNLNLKATYGFVTKENRQILDLPKEHYIDAVCIASQGNKIEFKVNNILYKKCVADGDYQQTKGIRSEQKIPTGKIQGFRKFDRIWYDGCKYFVKGRMSTGYAILMNFDGKKESLKPIPKFSKMKRIQARKSWIIFQKTTQNIC